MDRKHNSGREPRERSVKFFRLTKHEERMKQMEDILFVRMVKYNEPVLTNVKKPGGGRLPRVREARHKTREEVCKKVEKNPDAVFTEDEITLLMKNLYPDLTWEDDYSVYTRSVSLEKATKHDLENLIKEVEGFLEAPSVPKFTTAEKYENLLLTAFDECIRQIMMERPVLGVLFRVIRDYMGKSFALKRNLYFSSIAFYGRKDIQLTNEIKHLEEELSSRRELLEELDKELEHLRAEQESIGERFQREVDVGTEEYMRELQPILADKRRYLQKLKNLCLDHS